MKRLLAVLILFFVVFSFSYASTPKDVFTVDNITWLGLDFSHIKLIGDGFNNPKEIKEVFFKGWNDLILNESGKYNIAKFFHKTSVTNNVGIVEKRNNDVDFSKLLATEPEKIDKSLIQKAIQGYDFGNMKGIALVFFMDNFNKTAEKGTMWVTFIDVSAKSVLFTEKMEGKCGGFGFRNFWAKSFYTVMQDCNKRYAEWQEKYGK